MYSVSHKSLRACARRRATHSTGNGTAPYTTHFRWSRAFRGHIRHLFIRKWAYCKFTVNYFNLILLPIGAEGPFGHSVVFLFSVLMAVGCGTSSAVMQGATSHIHEKIKISTLREGLLQEPLI